MIDDTNEELFIFKGFKDIKSGKKISVRKIRLKKIHVTNLIDIKKTIILLKNNEGDFRRLLSIKDLIDLNKTEVKYVPCKFREVSKFYNDVTRKFIEFN